MIMMYAFEVLIGIIIFVAALSQPWSWTAFVAGLVGAAIGLDGIARACKRYLPKPKDQDPDTPDQSP